MRDSDAWRVTFYATACLCAILATVIFAREVQNFERHAQEKTANDTRVAVGTERLAAAAERLLAP